MNIKKEEAAPSPVLSRNGPAEGQHGEHKRKQVTFNPIIDLTGTNDEKESYRVLMPPPPPPSSRSALNDMSSNTGTNISFKLEYDPDPVGDPGDPAAVPPAPTSQLEPSKQRSATSSATNTRMRTSAITLIDTNHGRQRRQERAIPRRDIQAAVRYGKELVHPDPNKLIFEYQGKRHIVTKEDRLHITSMVTTVNLKDKIIGDIEWRKHEQDCHLIHHSETHIEWNSHSVLVVDRSGSMRNSDVNGCRTRLGAVWLSIAKDFVEYRLETGMASSMDAVTIILMGEGADVIIDRWPTDRVLYNRIVRYFHDSEEADILYHKRKDIPQSFIRPSGHGCYGPSLKKAQEMLVKYDDSSSPMQLLLLSDGRPSDNISKGSTNIENILKPSIEEMASKFGRRFDFAAIGMGNMKDYDCLKSMVASCEEFGGRSSLQVPGMSCAEIGAAFTSAATSVMVYQTELADGGGPGNERPRKKQRRIRSCLRESSRLLPVLTEVVDDSFQVYMNEKVERCLYQDVSGDDIDADAEQEGDQNAQNPKRKPKKTFVPANLQHPEAKGVALKRKAFGEGQERFAHQFFEVGEDGETVLGQPLVAKESRFVDDTEHRGGELDWLARDKFVERFCKIQHHCVIVAEAFNQKLNSIMTLERNTPRVSFIDCHVYYLTDDKRGQFSVIVEPKLEGRFEKWNNNNGWRMQSTADTGGRTVLTIKEEDDSSDDSVIDITGNAAKETICVTKNEVAQAFSHFSHHWTRKQSLICDLQGAYSEYEHLFKFTDPVVHYHNARRDSKKGKFGKTDLGQKGIDSFFKSHKCNKLCDLVTKGFMTTSR